MTPNDPLMPQVSTGSPNSNNSISKAQNTHWKMPRSGTPSDLAISNYWLYRIFF